MDQGKWQQSPAIEITGRLHDASLFFNRGKVFSVMLRKFFSFGAIKFLPIWLEESGPAKTFYAIAGIQTALVSMVPLYFYGKVMREFYHRHNPFRLLYVAGVHRLV